MRSARVVSPAAYDEALRGCIQRAIDEACYHGSVDDVAEVWLTWQGSEDHAVVGKGVSP